MSKTVYCDVDETLVFWNRPKCIHSIVVEGYILLPNVKQIAKLREHSENGAEIVVWSGGGQAWAQTVVRALQLETIVALCLTKPDIMYDDLRVPMSHAPVRHFPYDPMDHVNCPSEE